MKKLSQKQERERDVLFGVVETFIATGRPVGSNTLKENGFEYLSSATIRNYFSKLEEEGYLSQQHSSGGRIPSEKAFHLYAKEFSDKGVVEDSTLTQIEKLQTYETKEIPLLIRKTLEELSLLTDSPAFISSPKFDQDFIADFKILPLDSKRTLIALLTDFGSIQTEILYTEQKISSFSAKRIESYLNFRLSGQNKPDLISPEEEELANRFYSEVIVRFFVGYTNFSSEEIHCTGFSKMLRYPELREASSLADALSLFENTTSLRHILRDTGAHKELKFWIGEDLLSFGSKSKDIAVIAIPYFINAQEIGAFGILGPIRLPYRKIFGILKAMSHALSRAITQNLYKFQITYRPPERFQLLLPELKMPRIEHKPVPLIESKKGV